MMRVMPWQSPSAMSLIDHMIAQLLGEITFSDGVELILLTGSGVGHQVFFNEILPEGTEVNLYISHIIRENGEQLFGFKSLRGKKLFEMLNKVKGVGPKSSYSIITTLGVESIFHAIVFEDKKLLTKAPGVGAKAASQILLDLKEKIGKIKMYSDHSSSEHTPQVEHYAILDETVMACKELGFKEDSIIPLAQKFLRDSNILKAEQLIHLVLKAL
ncbi:MAG: hypothetical protein DRQ88_12640 [Epsilonproteobacteria bacterium]|nr:MAG: hypothetical protein DRQ89_12895 [Campylobacterota bacterium]RLA63286.1 MAG: hypothetical protein DRQ88_12640 [Campylobacterota bacterium]